VRQWIFRLFSRDTNADTETLIVTSAVTLCLLWAHTSIRRCFKSLTSHIRCAATFCFLSAAGMYSRSFCEFFVNTVNISHQWTTHIKLTSLAGYFFRCCFELLILAMVTEPLCTASLQTLQSEILVCTTEAWEIHQISPQTPNITLWSPYLKSRSIFVQLSFDAFVVRWDLITYCTGQYWWQKLENRSAAGKLWARLECLVSWLTVWK